jgi:hypothetical protein
VPLAITDQPVSEGGCYTIGWDLLLVADPGYGVGTKTEAADPYADPLYWPKGYTGWRVGSEVEVRDTNDNVVATTGRSYFVSMGLTPQGASTQGRTTSGSCLQARTGDPAPSGWLLFALGALGVTVAFALLMRRTKVVPED